MTESGSCDALKRFIESDEFGSGKVSVVAYTTGWVARIKNEFEPNKPAFLESLEWVRDHQLEDGSWGTTYPVLLFERIVSTLICVICLRQWGMEKDRNRIEQGTAYITKNLKHLTHLEAMQGKMTVGFVLILPMLIDEAESFGITFGHDQIIQIYRNERKDKINKILMCETSGIFDGTQIKPWYYNLEAFGTLYSEEDVIKMVFLNDLICSSYGATASALSKGIKMDRSLEHIRKIVSEYNGDVPPCNKMDIFDLAWSFNSLILAGFNMNQGIVKRSLNKLEMLWKSLKGMVGGCVGLPPDAYDTANTLFALSSTHRIIGVKSVDPLLKFFRKNYFITFESEKHPSLSTNINCLLALKNFQHHQDIRSITYKVYEWTKNRVASSNFEFEDRWHYSNYYSMSRALLAFDYIDHNMSESIYKMLLDQQNVDGGWGSDGHSTHLESSYLIISIIYWLKNHRSLNDQRGFYTLKRSRLFMVNYNHEDEQAPF